MNTLQKENRVIEETRRDGKRTEKMTLLEANENYVIVVVHITEGDKEGYVYIPFSHVNTANAVCAGTVFHKLIDDIGYEDGDIFSLCLSNCHRQKRIDKETYQEILQGTSPLCNQTNRYQLVKGAFHE